MREQSIDLAIVDLMIGGGGRSRTSASELAGRNTGARRVTYAGINTNAALEAGAQAFNSVNRSTPWWFGIRDTGPGRDQRDRCEPRNRVAAG